MRRGINVGNTLDVEGDHHDGRRVDADVIGVISAAGFDVVRLPVRWSAHAADVAPFAIEPSFFELVDDAVTFSLDAGLDVIVDVHHYAELCADPIGESPRFVALWSQIAARYAGRSSRLSFELLNEPRGRFTAARWNRLVRLALDTIRRSNHDRTVLVGPVAMYAIDVLADLDVPDDEHLVVTVHYYAPIPFTHQGAPWCPGAGAWTGTTWDRHRDGAAVRADLETLAAWARQRDVPVFVGEFGTYEAADMASRAAWTDTVRRELERLGIGWCYWDLRSDFGAYDATLESWREPLRAALLDP